MPPSHVLPEDGQNTHEWPMSTSCSVPASLSVFLLQPECSQMRFALSTRMRMAGRRRLVPGRSAWHTSSSKCCYVVSSKPAEESSEPHTGYGGYRGCRWGCHIFNSHLSGCSPATTRMGSNRRRERARHGIAPPQTRQVADG